MTLPGRSGKTHTMNPIGPVWRFTVCDTDGLQTSVHLGPVKRAGQDLSASLTMTITLPMPDQDEHLPDLLEAAVHAAGLEVQRQLFARADREGGPRVDPGSPRRQRGSGHSAAGDTPIHVQDHLRLGHRPAVPNLAPSGRFDRDPRGDGVGHVASTDHLPDCRWCLNVVERRDRDPFCIVQT